jgi:hypothetical protein
MSADYHQRALAAFRETRADFLGCSTADFDSHALTVCERPDGPYGKYVLSVMTFGTGTVAGVQPDYLEWVRENAPKDKHYRAMFPNVLLQPLADEAKRRGETLGWRAPNLIFLPAGEPVALPLPDGLRALPFEHAWREERFPSGEFHNALGELDDPDDEYFRYGLALMDGETVAAVAGGWDDCNGLIEIGVDVARNYRGRGLGEVVVTNVAKLIADRGQIPTYYCAPTNVRSHRNALGSGFVPVASSVRATLPAAPVTAPPAAPEAA